MLAVVADGELAVFEFLFDVTVAEQGVAPDGPIVGIRRCHSGICIHWQGCNV